MFSCSPFLRDLLLSKAVFSAKNCKLRRTPTPRRKSCHVTVHIKLRGLDLQRGNCQLATAGCLGRYFIHQIRTKEKAPPNPAGRRKAKGGREGKEGEKGYVCRACAFGIMRA